MRPAISVLLAVVAAGCAATRPADHESLQDHARRLTRENIVIDTHIDLPMMLHERWEDITERLPDGDFDLIRARAGGLQAPFMSIYIPPEEEPKGTAKALADTLIDMVYGIARRWPDTFAVAVSTSDVRDQFKRGVMSLPMGMENGAPISGKLENVRYFYDRGIRYITLCHGKDNHISDSSYDTTHTWHGLSPFGKQVVAEMNRVGIMVDVSHISDEAFFDVMKVSTSPVIASHSSCRFFTPGFERNMSDEMIRLLAKNGGVIQINFGSEFLDTDFQQWEARRMALRDSLTKERGLAHPDSSVNAAVAAWRAKHPIPYAPIAKVAQHIDHVVKIAGIDHVGFGSDFDGVGDMLPVGLKDVSGYPNLIVELLKLGYSDDDVKKVCGENLLRVWAEVERRAKAGS